MPVHPKTKEAFLGEKQKQKTFKIVIFDEKKIFFKEAPPCLRPWKCCSKAEYNTKAWRKATESPIYS